jgi:hypothetical protein
VHSARAGDRRPRPGVPHRGLDAARSTADTAAIGPHTLGRGERWSPEGPRNDG